MNIPTATYRLQFNPDFGFQNAARLISYMEDLGISHIYASPIFKARKGSPHGYDGVDPNQLDPDLGSSEEFEKLTGVLQKHGIGWLQDIVPNHMAYDYENRILRDVLENGPSSEYYHFFDITWDHPDEGMHGRLLAPFLGRRYNECLENGEIKLSYNAAGFAVIYYDLKLPLRMASYLDILGHQTERIKVRFGGEDAAFARLRDLLDNLASLSSPLDPAGHRNQVRSIKETLWDLYCSSSTIKKFVDENLRRFNGDRSGGGRYDLLDQILSRQMFRLCHWKVACEEINYRRFFDIDDLIALCQEKEAVFDHTHALLTKLVVDGIVSGLRIDHIDGLRDPTQYLRRLRHRFGDVYVVIEKILEPTERLPEFWPVQGTTGYEFSSMVNGLFIQRHNENKITEIYTCFSRQQNSFESLAVASKRKVLESQMAGELDNLAGLIKRLSARTRAGRDFTMKRLKEALAEILIRFPVYRSYIDPEILRKADIRYIRSAVELSGLHRPDRRPELAFLQRLLLGEFANELAGDGSENDLLHREMTARFQQLTAPLMAKGVEDTALYAYNRLLSLNEVGDQPNRFGCRLAAFHAFIKKRAKKWPHAMSNSATHDSKRGEDVRARLNVLTEIPEEWATILKHWHGINRHKKKRPNGREMPDTNDEYLLYQTLLGIFPLGDFETSALIERIRQYMIKAAREAKVHTSWLNPDEAYEAALSSFVEAILSASDENQFLKAFLPFCQNVACYGIYNSLSQSLLKITAPGVPDFYQGTELFDFNLVDPDNRRPVDFEKRKRYLAEIMNSFSSDPLHLIRELITDRRSGRIKLFLIAQALRTRNEYAALFQDGSYVQLAAAGRYKAHVIAFSRIYKNRCSITVVPRFLTGLIKENQNPLGDRVWGDTKIIFPQKTASRWRNIFTEEILSADATFKIGDILQHFPCALLLREDNE
ncbi:MAG: malto-oligosyltrehalose synthase [Deltaproteobacteria bacterium]|jgi:(1->4)-alpha-D-glucan 1-alpha-D-glucosylmutase|nr:malto-oligosyltrehalose synthase [Deltaproteobacteria bacterium]